MARIDISPYLVHEVVIEPYLGRNADGPIYGPPVRHPCLISETRKLVRAADGRQRTVGASIHMLPGTEVPEESRATVHGRVRTVIAVSIRDGGGRLPTPDHVLVQCE